MSAAGKPEPLRRRLTAPTIDPDIGASELTEHDDDDEEAVATPPKQTNWAATLIAGGIAGGASRTSVAPLERIKRVLEAAEALWRGERRQLSRPPVAAHGGRPAASSYWRSQ